jgi:hypothetical protein
MDTNCARAVDHFLYQCLLKAGMNYSQIETEFLEAGSVEGSTGNAAAKPMESKTKNLGAATSIILDEKMAERRYSGLLYRRILKWIGRDLIRCNGPVRSRGATSIEKQGDRFGMAR